MRYLVVSGYELESPETVVVVIRVAAPLMDIRAIVPRRPGYIHTFSTVHGSNLKLVRIPDRDKAPELIGLRSAQTIPLMDVCPVVPRGPRDIQTFVAMNSP